MAARFGSTSDRSGRLQATSSRQRYLVSPETAGYTAIRAPMVINAIILKASMMAALVVAIVAFVLCVVVAVSPFLGFADIFARATFLLFVGMFPLFFGAMRVLGRRTKGQRFEDWAAILFHGLPKWFTAAYRFYFLVIWVGGVAAIIQAFRGQPSWIGLLFVLVPSVFYLTCVGAYWSVVREMADGEQGLPADAEDRKAEG